MSVLQHILDNEEALMDQTQKLKLNFRDAPEGEAAIHSMEVLIVRSLMNQYIIKVNKMTMAKRGVFGIRDHMS